MLPSLLAWSALLVGTCSLFWLLFRKTRKQAPGPWGLPVIGASHIVARYENPWEAFSALSKRYGNVFQLRLGSRLCLVVSSADGVREVLLGKVAADFVDRPDFLRYHSIFRGDRNYSVALCDWSSKHRHRRDVVHGGLHPRPGSECRVRLGRCVHRELEGLVQRLQAAKGRPLEVRPALKLTMANIFFDFLCSKRYSEDDAVFTRVVDLYDAVFQELFKGFALDFMPWLKLFQNRKLEDLRRQASIISELTAKIVDEREKVLDGKERDLLDQLLLSSEKMKDHPDGLGRIDVEVTLEDFLGGHSVVANFWLWALYLLASYGEEAQKKICEEVRRQTVDAEQDADEEQQLPYTEATLYEVLRMVNSPIIPHVCSRDTNLHGFHVSKGTLVMFNTHDLNFSDDLWEEPWNFRPERFLNNGSKTVTKPAHFVPFGSGRRACLGDGLVRATLIPALATLCSRFRITLGPDQAPADLKTQRTRVIFDRDPLLVFLPLE